MSTSDPELSPLPTLGWHCQGVQHVALRRRVLIIALIAAVFGFGGIAAGAVRIAKILFFRLCHHGRGHFCAQPAQTGMTPCTPLLYCFPTLKEKTMKYARALAFAALAGATIVSTGCSVARNQQTVGPMWTTLASPRP